MIDHQSLKFTASGKFFLFGEYLVLRGAQSLSLPLRFGQTLEVSKSKNGVFNWECFQFKDSWLKIKLSRTLEVLETNDPPKAGIIQNLLKLIKTKNPELFKTPKDFNFHLDFDRNFGLGTSSTLISLLSQWSGTDPYLLLENSFGGSGYDLAAATANSPILYTIKDRWVKGVSISPEIQSHLLFVYLGQKQKSSREIASFKNKKVTQDQVERMNKIIQQAVDCESIETWEMLMDESEDLLAKILETQKVKALYFSDYPYSIKSMGAWGGDFIMASFRDKNKGIAYFLEKGMTPIYSYPEIAKQA